MKTVFGRCAVSAALFALLLGSTLAAEQAEETAKAEEKPVEKLTSTDAVAADVTQGALKIEGKDGKLVECPLKHTDVTADVSGFIARVKVVQTFLNPTDEKIEAVYVFPLPNESAVDDMTMVIGDRKIVGVIKRRAEARSIYEQAIAAGNTAALLEQERPNIFTQTVGNIEPGQEVKIEISYVDVLKYDMGSYEFHFPMVVGPRYNPGGSIASPAPLNKELDGKAVPSGTDTTEVPDGSKINPPVLKPGFRNGHDISLRVTVDAGVPIQDVKVGSHEVKIDRTGASKADVVLSDLDSVPNKDFVLRYDVSGKKPEMALLAHTGDFSKDARRLGDYFMMMIQPSEDERLTKGPPREIVFLVDTSGSMSGAPTEKVREAMGKMLELCREKDTVQVVTFASQAHALFEKPVPVTDDNVKKAVAFSRDYRSGGGTEMLKGVKLAIDQPLDKERLRIVVMLSDGYIGNEAQIIEHVGKNCGDKIRFWAIGMGTSPNMFLIDGVAKQGGGMGKRLNLTDDTNALTTEVMTRIQRAQLADIEIEFGDLDVVETYPRRIPELWSGRPVILFGRYKGAGGKSDIKVKGNVEGEAAEWTLSVDLPAEQPEHEVLAKVWARKKIEDLMQQSYYGGTPAVEEEVTALALDYSLMSQYTSFVAVDAKEADKLETSATPPRRMMVPVPLPAGTQFEGFFGGGGEQGEFLRDRGGARVEKLAELKKSVAQQAFQPARPTAAATPFGIQGLNRANTKNYYANPQANLFGTNGLASNARGLTLQNSSLPAGKGGGLGGGGGFGYAGRTVSRRSGGVVAGSLVADARKQVARSKVELDGIAQLGDFQTPTAETTKVNSELEVLQKEIQEAKDSVLTKDVEDLSDADREKLIRSLYTAVAFSHFNYSDGQLANQALSRLQSLRDEQVAKWTKDQPELDAKLDLVLRNISLADAVAKVNEASKLSIQLADGALADAEALTGKTPHITYLDLRGATVAEALDWLLLTEQLTWTLNKDQVIANSARRGDDVNGWVYSIATMVRPTKEEMDAVKEPAEKAKLYGDSCEALLAALRDATKATDKDLFVYSPDSIVVIGDAKLHAQVSDLLAKLQDPDAKLEGKLAAIRDKCVSRHKIWSEQLAAIREIDAVGEQAAAFDDYGWALLSAAAGAELNLEALTELQVASQGELLELKEGAVTSLLLRTCWQVSEASKALPNNAELAELAAKLQKATTAAVEQAAEDLGKEPKDSAAALTLLYAAIADHPALTADARKQVLAKVAEADPNRAAIQTVATALLSESPDGKDLAKLFSGESQVYGGEDLAVLIAVAAKRVGGNTWQAYRANADFHLKSQPLDGNVLVLINRLSQEVLPVASR